MLTPADIENKEFKKEMRGYNITEVNIFLKEVAMSYEKIYQENLSAMDRIGMLSDAVKQYKSMEDTLKNALSVAKGAGDEIKNSAHGQAQMIIKDAENKAVKIINEAAKEVADINYKYDIVIANIVADIILRLLVNISKVVKSKSYFLASGILQERADEIEKAIKDAGFNIIKTEIKRGWAAILAQYN